MCAMPRACVARRNKIAKHPSRRTSAVALYDTLLLTKVTPSNSPSTESTNARPNEQPPTVLLRNDITEFTQDELTALAALRLGDAATSPLAATHTPHTMGNDITEEDTRTSPCASSTHSLGDDVDTNDSSPIAAPSCPEKDDGDDGEEDRFDSRARMHGAPRRTSHTHTRRSSSLLAPSAHDTPSRPSTSTRPNTHMPRRRSTTTVTHAHLAPVDLVHLTSSPAAASDDPAAVAESILRLHHLDLSRRGQVDTAAAELALNLTHLNLSHNAITHVDGLTLLAHLQVLHIRDNRLTSLRPLAQLRHLSYLDARHNDIAALQPAHDLPTSALRYLDLRDNPCDPWSRVALGSSASFSSASSLLALDRSPVREEAAGGDGEAAWRRWVEQICLACPHMDHVDGEEVSAQSQADARAASMESEAEGASVLTRAAAAAMREIESLRAARQRRQAPIAAAVADADAKDDGSSAQSPAAQTSTSPHTPLDTNVDYLGEKDDKDNVAVPLGRADTSQPSTRLRRALQEAQCVAEAVACRADSPTSTRAGAASRGDSAPHYIRATRWRGTEALAGNYSHAPDTAEGGGGWAARRSSCEARAESLVTAHERRLWRQFEQRAHMRRALVQRQVQHGAAETAATPSRRLSSSSLYREIIEEKEEEKRDDDEDEVLTPSPPRRRRGSSSASAPPVVVRPTSAQEEHEMAEARQMQSKLFRDIGYANTLVYGRLQRTLQSHWADVERVLQTRHALAAARRARREAESAQPSLRYERALAMLRAERQNARAADDGPAQGAPKSARGTT